MNVLVEKFPGIVKGVVTGFDRIVFKGWLLPLMDAAFVQGFLSRQGILNKDYRQWVQAQTAAIVQDAGDFAMEQTGQEITPIMSSATRKEDLARQRQQEAAIESGLIGVWSAVESCSSYKARFCARAKFPQLVWTRTKCKHLYFYFDHEDFGFMNVRLQTWFPYHIQVALNGREWLCRDLERHGCEFVAKGNKLLHVADYDLAQRLLDQQLDARWDRILDSFLPLVFPTMPAILGPRLQYYWTLWQSEWATDLAFPTPDSLNRVTDKLLRHAFMTGTSARVLRYLDRPITKEGKPYANMNNEVSSRMLDFNEGVRVRHWVDHNSVKVYNERNILRVEMTMNQPGMFKVHRRAQGETEPTPKRRLPLRKGIADIPLRAQVSQEVNERFMNQLAACADHTPARECFEAVCRPKTKSGRRVRALDLTGKDRALLEAISDPAFAIEGITNKSLRQKLCQEPGYAKRTTKQLRAKLSRHLRLLRDHGLIRKAPRQNRYYLTGKGRQLTTALNALLAASTQQLMENAA